MVFGCVLNVNAQVTTTDSIFIADSRPVKFVVDRIDISKSDQQWIVDVLIPELKRLGSDGIIIGRAAASPEGPWPNNSRLANGRCASVNDLLRSYGIDTSIIRYDVVPEDYLLLHALMKYDGDEAFPTVDSLMVRYGDDYSQLKLALRRIDGGKLWKRIVSMYSPQLRAVRIMAIDRKLVADRDTCLVSPTEREDTCMVPDVPDVPDVLDVPNMPDTVMIQKLPRREMFSVKTNLLLDFAYMPGYGRFCPIPNVSIEFYPLHGHFTYGASFDCPWWQDYDGHKYFQLRNYQLHTRYYLRSGDIAVRQPGEGAAFKGLFFSAYAHAFLYNICFGEKRGWEGEGWGAGLGIGYSQPLGKKEHWRLDFGMQVGYFNTRYDPYQWLCPVDPAHDRPQYYYKWYGDARDFKTRQYRFSWVGPTRVDVTISYDIIYRKRK